MQAIDEKMLDKVDALIKREEERQLEIKKRKEVKEHVKDAENEKLGVFQKIYEEECQQIDTAIESAKCVPANMLPEHFENIYKSILNLQKYVAASNVFLRVYDIQRSNKRLQELTNKAKEVEDQFLPKKKFGFKNRKAAQKTVEKKQNGVSKDEVDFVKPSNVFVSYDTEYCGYRDKSNENLVLKNEEVHRKDVELRNLDHCTLRCYGNPSTLHMSNIKDSVILCGPVTTSIFAENCSNCTFVIACQQLRLHSSRNIRIYLHVTSKGIVEDCTDIFVAPYNLKYDQIEEHFKMSGLDKNLNHWDNLDDFNWLNVKHHSPNWMVLDKNSRIENWDDFVGR